LRTGRSQVRVLLDGPLQGVAQPGSAPGLEPGGRRFESYRPDHFPRPNNRRLPCDATTTNCRPFETSRKRRRGLCFRNASAARRPRRARRQGADRETRAQRPVPVRLRTTLSKNAACAPAASTAASATTMSAINRRTEDGRPTTDDRAGPSSVVCHPSSQPDEPSALPRTPESWPSGKASRC
jgi:hypothetical protein